MEVSPHGRRISKGIPRVSGLSLSTSSTAVNPREFLNRFEKLEDAFLAGLQEIRCIKVEIQRQIERNETLEPLLEAEDVAKILGVDVQYVYTQARAKKIPSIKLGKYRKFSPSEIQKWLHRKNTA